MTADEFRANLENELKWRQEEIAFFKNQLNYITEHDKNRYRKSLVLILYSHMVHYIIACSQITRNIRNKKGGCHGKRYASCEYLH